MENRNGQGIFLGVVGVATLVVAIIGATFAFFTAQIQGDNNVEVQSYEFASTLSVTEMSDGATISNGALIPLNDDDVLDAANNVSTKGMCVDTRGYDACQIYKLEFSNTGSSDVTFEGVLSSTTNQFSAGVLRFYQLGGKDEGEWTTGTAHDMPAVNNATAEGVLNDVLVKAGETETVYLVVYVKNDPSNAQEEMGKSFVGRLTYTSSDGGQLQAQISA